jgi:hypothetical protein
VVRDYFTPHDQARLSDGDADLGSSGPLLLPDQPGPHRHLLLQPTKGSMIYAIDRDQMGKFRPDGDAIVQRIRMAGGGYGAMAYWNGHVFFACSDDFLRDYAIDKGDLKLSAYSNTRFENPGATPSVSANGNKCNRVGKSRPKHGTAPADRQYSTPSMPTRLTSRSTPRSRTASAIAPRWRRAS